MAASWNTRRNKYLALGLCEECAGQAAWGHQSGFGPHEHVRAGHLAIESVRPPCKSCAPVVAGFPIPAAGPWRKHPAAMIGGYGSGAEHPVPAEAGGK
jgi:hypothetical protein